jgi:secreted trypsin-like serine protease
VRLRRLATTVAAALGVVVAAASPAAAVAHGTPASPGQYPFAVKLTMTGIPRADGTTYSSACSAALISPTWIVTAGHCFHDVARNRVSGPTPYATTATLNTVDVTRNPGETRRVVYVRQSATNDIALAQLSAPVTDVAPLRLPTSAPARGQLLTLAGWGATSSTNPLPSNQLRTGVVRVTSVGSTTVLVTGSSPSRDTSACLYDSGAPYVRSVSGVLRLVSVESTGPDCPHSANETTSRVDAVTGWVRTMVGDLP